MLQATVQGNFLFLGKKRKSGEIISSKELQDALNAEPAKTTMTAINALKNAKLIILSDDNDAPGGNVDRSFDVTSGSIHEKLDSIMKHLGIDQPAQKAAPKAKKTAAAKKAA